MQVWRWKGDKAWSHFVCATVISLPGKILLLKPCKRRTGQTVSKGAEKIGKNSGE